MTFQYYEDAAHAWRWRLVAANGRIVADSAESYTTKAHCLRAIKTVVDGMESVIIDGTA